MTDQPFRALRHRHPSDGDAPEGSLQALRLLGDPTRVSILGSLVGRELPVKEIARTLGATPNAVSQQLRLLRALRLVAARRDGRQVLYRVLSAQVEALVAELDRLRSLLRGQ